MTDIIDKASKIEQMQRDNALNNTRVKQIPLIINGVRCCKECEEPILPSRIKSVNAVRCISCQELHEHQQKHYIRTGRQY